MRKLFFICAFFVAGCETVRGPFAPKPHDRIDNPHMSIPEQQRQGRDRMGHPDNSKVLPQEAGARPGR